MDDMTPDLIAEIELRSATTWQPSETAPTDGQEFLAELSNGWVVILYATSAVTRRQRYSWWGYPGSAAVPYEPTHPADTSWSDTTARLTGWMVLPKSRLECARLERELGV